MNHKYLLGLVFGVVVMPTVAIGAEKSFDGITCETNISSALMGRQMSNERVAVLEARYKKIGLKDMGAFGMEIEGDPWTLISWQICGREFVVLEKKNIVRDVLASPLPVGSPKSDIASCTSDGAALKGTSVVFFEEAEDDEEGKWENPVKYAWFIDDKAVKFQKITGTKITCEP